MLIGNSSYLIFQNLNKYSVNDTYVVATVQLGLTQYPELSIKVRNTPKVKSQLIQKDSTLRAESCPRQQKPAEANGRDPAEAGQQDDVGKGNRTPQGAWLTVAGNIENTEPFRTPGAVKVKSLREYQQRQIGDW